MFRSRYQKGCFSVLYSIGSSPLQYWASHVQNGYVKRVFDEDIKSIVMEIMGSNVSTMFITAPRDPKLSLGIKLPFLVLLIKNLHKYFTFEVKVKRITSGGKKAAGMMDKQPKTALHVLNGQILDDQRFMRRFRVSNFQSKTVVKPFCTSMPMGMSPGWNQIHFNLADFTRRAYGTNYMETVRLQIHANVRIRRIYFTDRLYTEENLPNEFRLMAKPKEKQKHEYKVPAARPPSPAKSVATSDKPSTVEADKNSMPPSEAAPPAEGDEGIEKYF